MNSTTPIFNDATVTISVTEFEHLIECKKELGEIKLLITSLLGDDL